MSPVTSQEREDLILCVLSQHPKGMGINKLQEQTEIPKKTLYKCIKKMEEENHINKEKLGNRTNSDVLITIKFSDKIKNVIDKNLKVTTQHHWQLYKTKIQRSNVFPHYLQQLASEYYEYMLYRLFDNSAVYKFALNRLEEHLDEERKRLEKAFGKKELERILESCDDLSMDLWSSSISAMRNAGMRNKYRTSDEIIIDTINIQQLFLPTPDLESKYTPSDLRICSLKNKNDHDQYRKLIEEYNKLSDKLMAIKDKLAAISGVYPFEKCFLDISIL